MGSAHLRQLHSKLRLEQQADHNLAASCRQQGSLTRCQSHELSFCRQDITQSWMCRLLHVQLNQTGGRAIASSGSRSPRYVFRQRPATPACCSLRHHSLTDSTTACPQACRLRPAISAGFCAWAGRLEIPLAAKTLATQVGRGQKLGDGAGSMNFGDMTVEGLLQVGPLQDSSAAAADMACCSATMGPKPRMGMV